MPHKEIAPGKIKITNPLQAELEAIKSRQKARKEAGTPTKASNELLYEMLSDILENQARIENKLNEMLARR